MLYKSIRFISAFVLASVGLFTFSSSFAQTASADFDVTASVAEACVINTAPFDFGAYSPVLGIPVSPSVDSISVKCNLLTTYEVGLSDGDNSIAAGTRRMKNIDPTITDNNFLEYGMSCGVPDLTGLLPTGIVVGQFVDTACATTWGLVTTTSVFAGIGIGDVALPLPVVGSIAASQNVAVGNYLDTLTATIEF